MFRHVSWLLERDTNDGFESETTFLLYRASLLARTLENALRWVGETGACSTDQMYNGVWHPSMHFVVKLRDRAGRLFDDST